MVNVVDGGTDLQPLDAMTRLNAALDRPTWNRVALRRPMPVDVPTLAGAVVAAVGAVVLVGWLVDSDLLKSVVPRAVAMKPNTAVAFLLLGTGLALAGRSTPGDRSRWVGLALMLSAATIGMLTGIEYLTGRDLGIDQLLFRGSAPDPGGAPGRMAPLTAVCFVLLGVAAALAARGRARRVVLVLATMAAFVSALNIFGVAFSAATPSFLAGYSAMAIHTAISMCILAVGIVGLYGAESPFAGLSGPSATARLYRRLLAVSIAVPVIMAWARLEGQGLGLYDTSYGTSLMLVGTVTVIAIAILQAARWARLLENRRDAAEVERDRFFELSLDLLVVMDIDGRFRRVNQAWVDLFGYPAAEVVGRPWTEFVHPEDVERSVKEAGRSKLEREPVNRFVNRYRRSDGSYVWLEWSSQTAPDQSASFAIARDITTRKRNEDRRARERRSLLSDNESLTEQAGRDPLTGLHNRRYFDAAVVGLQHAWASRPLDGRPPVSLIVFDLDHFGALNKLYGHQLGDTVLQAFARILATRFRDGDLIVRYGGEEFVAVLEGATSADAVRIAEGIRQTLAELPIEVEGGDLIHVTVSAGCAQLGDEQSVSAALTLADVWLSQAKRAGRNQVVGLQPV